MATMDPTIPNSNMPTGYEADSKQGVLGSVPAWGSYLYSNFLLPAFSPSEWLNSNTPTQATIQQTDYFNSQPQPQAQSSRLPNHYIQPQQQQHQQQQSNPYSIQRSSTNPLPYSQNNAGPSNYYTNPNYFASSIPTSLLVSQQPSSSDISPSVDVIDAAIVNPSPSPRSMHSQHPTPHASPKSHAHALSRGTKRRASSMDSADSHDEIHEHEIEHDIAEGVERDGMIWGMKVEDYRALSARERKRVRNRISARTFRAKRKEHLSALELDIESKDMQVKAANDEAARLRVQVAELKARLSKYERV